MVKSALLGPLEQEIMDVLWEVRKTTGRAVFARLAERREIAYTTVLTVMNNLLAKGLLKRVPVGRAHAYSPAMTREEFIDRECNKAVSQVLSRFGDLAVARFLDQAGHMSPEVRREAQRLLSHTDGGKKYRTPTRR